MSEGESKKKRPAAVIDGRLALSRVEASPRQPCHCSLRPRAIKLVVWVTQPWIQEIDCKHTLSAAAVCRLCGDGDAGINGADDDDDDTVVEDSAPETKPREAMVFGSQGLSEMWLLEKLWYVHALVHSRRTRV